MLQLERVGVEDNFFDLGGHSLSAITTMARLQEMLKTQLPLTTIFQAQTIENLAALIEKGATQGFSTLVQLNKSVTGPTLYCFPPGGGGHATSYRPLANALSGDINVYGVQARDLIDENYVPDDMQTLVKDYAEQIIQHSPKGPYHLLGWCLGAQMVMEVAHYLESNNQPVGLVAIVDYDSQVQIKQPETESLELVTDFIDYINAVGIQISDANINELKQQIARKSYTDGLDYLIHYGLQNGYLSSQLTQAQLKIKFMAEKQASRLMKANVMPCISSDIVLWMTAEKVEHGHKVLSAWQNHSYGKALPHILQEDHFSIIQSAPFFAGVRKSLLGGEGV